MTSSSSSFTDFVLGELKVASLRSKLAAAEIDSIVTALAGNFIGAEGAVEWARDIGLTFASTA